MVLAQVGMVDQGTLDHDLKMGEGLAPTRRSNQVHTIFVGKDYIYFVL